MKKALIIIGSIVLAIVIIAAAAFGIYWHSAIHWYDKYESALQTVGAAEKQATLPNGRVINYGEVNNDKPALLLIHGQMSIWQDYALVMPELSKNWHIYAVDVYGHGKSSHDENLYYLDVNGDDLIRFINEVIGEPTVVAGHSNGGLTAAYVAANGGKNIAGAVLEDPLLMRAAELSVSEELPGGRLFGIGCSPSNISYLDRGVISGMIIPNEFTMGYQSLAQLSRCLSNDIPVMKDIEIGFSGVLTEEVHDPENEKLLFPVVQ